MSASSSDLADKQARAASWFATLRDRICAELETIERAAPPALYGGEAGAFVRTPWERTDHTGLAGGGGVMSMLKGRVFEKGGVHVSTVHGEFAPEFRKEIPGAADDPRFWAAGISLILHPLNPHVPTVHMNTRMVVTTKRWFGGGADLNPPLPIAEDTAEFHATLKAACDAHGADYYARFKKWADDYFYIPHRGVHRGAGGIFYDHLEGDFAANFAFTQAVGRAFLEVFPRIVRRRMHAGFTPAEEAAMLEWRGRYAEFNLVYDRGTLFGLKTGGNIDAILMSLPPRAVWS